MRCEYLHNRACVQHTLIMHVLFENVKFVFQSLDLLLALGLLVVQILDQVHVFVPLVLHVLVKFLKVKHFALQLLLPLRLI